MNSGYQVRRISGPDVEPISVAQARQQCRIDDDLTAEDDLLEDYIKAARELVERETKQVLVESTYEIFLNEWPCEGKVSLPIGPIIAINSFEYINSDGAYVPIEADSYYPCLLDEPPYLIYGSGGWPAVNCRPGAIRIEVRAGYAGAGSPADATNVPHTAKQAIKMLVAHWYENRESVATDTRMIPTLMPQSFWDLIYGLRRLF